MTDPTKRQYSAWGLVWLVDACDGLTLTELADAMGAPISTTEYRCKVLVEEGRLDKWRFGSGTHGRTIYFAADE